MQTRLQTSREYFRSLMTIYTALVAGQIVFLLVALLMQQMKQPSPFPPDFTGWFVWIVPVVIIFAVAGSWVFFRLRLPSIRQREELTVKMAIYRAMLIIRYAIMETASIFAIIGYFATGERVFALLAGLTILFFLTALPSRTRAVNDLEMNAEDQKAIMDPDAEIAVTSA
jgi:hypothetical protein